MPRSAWSSRGAGALAFGAGSLLAANAWIDTPLERSVLSMCGVFFVGVSLFAGYLWAVGWGFTSEEAGIRLRRGRKEELVTWGQIERVTEHGFVGWSRLQLRHPERSVIVPRPARPVDGGPPIWFWVRTDEGWRTAEAKDLASLVDSTETARAVDGRSLRSVSLAPARRGYAREPVEAFLERCADTLDALTSPGGPPLEVELVTPEDVERFQVGMARDGVDPAQVDGILEAIQVRLAALHADRREPEPP